MSLENYRKSGWQVKKFKDDEPELSNIVTLI
jgi:hypothetical protein